MITREQAIELGKNHALHVHKGECKKIIGPRGGVTYRIEEWRPNGACQIWLSGENAHKFKLPIKHGLYEYDYITHENADEFHLASECPIV